MIETDSISSYFTSLVATVTGPRVAPEFAPKLDVIRCNPLGYCLILLLISLDAGQGTDSYFWDALCLHPLLFLQQAIAQAMGTTQAKAVSPGSGLELLGLVSIVLFFGCNSSFGGSLNSLNQVVIEVLGDFDIVRSAHEFDFGAKPPHTTEVGLSDRVCQVPFPDLPAAHRL